MGKDLGPEPFTKEVTQVTETHDEEQRDIGGKQRVPRPLDLLVHLDRRTARMLRSMAELWICTMAELGVHCREHLLGGGGHPWVRQTVVVLLLLVQHGVLGRGRDGRR